ncbi:MAG TPA: CpsB/CapC family capsule biosynthesis tyrosine phosphatase [Bacillota bacterium]|nr:CpsB/CapC family capsule biosynthesis tyrosine phosphatase [Bacillota bacterium]
MIDLHTHIIPEIDDGAVDEGTATAMLQLAFENGTKTIVATPHVIEGEWLPEWQRIVAGCDLLRRLARKHQLGLSIFPGAEVALKMDLLDNLITGPGAYCINGGNYLLLELPAFEIPSYTEEFFFKLQTRGITPVLAHPERHPQIGREPELIWEWVRKGILIQMNGASFVGKLGERVAQTAELLLMNDLVHCVGSDAHGIHSRRPKLTDTAEKLRALVGEATAQRILVENPQKIIEGQIVEVPEVHQFRYPRKTGFWQRWFGKLSG